MEKEITIYIDIFRASEKIVQINIDSYGIS